MGAGAAGACIIGDGGGGGVSGTMGACADAADPAVIIKATARGQREERRVKIKEPLTV